MPVDHGIAEKTAVIQTDGLSKTYGGKQAVKSVSISVESGQIYGFLGPNGAGKSTCVKMLIGLVRPTSGGGRVLGRPLGDVGVRARIGYLPELFRYQDWMTGADLLEFHSRLFKLPPDKNRTRRALERTGLLGQERYKVGGYSKGMQQRIGLACALLPEPELLFLDEPTSALDPIGRKDVRDIILSLKSQGATVFLNSHLLSEVEAVSTHISIINNGRVVKSGPIEELLTQRFSLDVVCDAPPDFTPEELAQRFGAVLSAPEAGVSFSVGVKNREDIPEIAAFLIARGARLYGLSARHESLESLFLKSVTESDESDKAGAGAAKGAGA